jgi:hypothetical protein
MLGLLAVLRIFILLEITEITAHEELARRDENHLGLIGQASGSLLLRRR